MFNYGGIDSHRKENNNDHEILASSILSQDVYCFPQGSILTSMQRRTIFSPYKIIFKDFWLLMYIQYLSKSTTLNWVIPENFKVVWESFGYEISWWFSSTFWTSLLKLLNSMKKRCKWNSLQVIHMHIPQISLYDGWQ